MSGPGFASSPPPSMAGHGSSGRAPAPLPGANGGSFSRPPAPEPQPAGSARPPAPLPGGQSQPASARPPMAAPGASNAGFDPRESVRSNVSDLSSQPSTTESFRRRARSVTDFLDNATRTAWWYSRDPEVCVWREGRAQADYGGSRIIRLLIRLFTLSLGTCKTL